MKIRKNLIISRIGEIRINKWGNEMKIISYNNANDIMVEFDSGYKTKSSYSEFKIGRIKSPYDISVQGFGFIGEGKYMPSIECKITKEYSRWVNMLKRCYNEKFIKEFPTYKGCTVCEEWHNFQNFAQWYSNNYYEIEGVNIDLDKDILVKGNKIYSPNTCIFVPHGINSLFIKSDEVRGKYPIGVAFNKNNHKYVSRMKKLVDGKCKEVHLGYFDTPEQAFEKYKFEKEKHIKEVADKYKDKIPERLYIAMMNYEVEITD